MPRHLISDAHEWINEIPTVPIYYLAKPQPNETTRTSEEKKRKYLFYTEIISILTTQTFISTITDVIQNDKKRVPCKCNSY